MDAFEAHIAANQQRYWEELREFVAQPSVAAQNLGMETTAAWVAARLERIGAAVQVLRMPGAMPVIWATIGTGPRTLLIYDHYDVQPAEPFALWTSPPFTPTERDGKLYARGVADNKSNLLLRVQAVESWLASMGPLPVRVNFLIEGEEEIGSKNLEAFCQQHPELLKADGCLWETGGRLPTEEPTIHCGAKGITYVELVARGAVRDLHSANATIVPNPAWRLVWALATLKDQHERVLIPGFYDEVRPPSAADLDALESIPLDDALLLADYQIPAFLNHLEGRERIQAHLFNPTCNICGIVAGYTGEGSKTVLPNEARVKIDFRLVPEMNPHTVVAQLRAHLDAHGFGDIEIIEHDHEPAARGPVDAPVVMAMRRAIQTVYGMDAVVYPTMAATGPMHAVCSAFDTPVTSGCGTSYQGTNIHAPDENIRAADYWTAMRCMGAFMREFGA